MKAPSVRASILSRRYIGNNSGDRSRSRKSGRNRDFWIMVLSVAVRAVTVGIGVTSNHLTFAAENHRRQPGLHPKKLCLPKGRQPPHSPIIDNGKAPCEIRRRIEKSGSNFQSRNCNCQMIRCDPNGRQRNCSNPSVREWK